MRFRVQGEKLMSNIPNSAMPHAGGGKDADAKEGSGSSSSKRGAKIVEKARNNPKTAIAAGAAVVAGAVAAAATVRASRKKAAGEGASGGSEGGSGKGRSKKKS
jgi:hypothetical protein